MTHFLHLIARQQTWRKLYCSSVRLSVGHKTLRLFFKQLAGQSQQFTRNSVAQEF